MAAPVTASFYVFECASASQLANFATAVPWQDVLKPTIVIFLGRSFFSFFVALVFRLFTHPIFIQGGFIDIKDLFFQDVLVVMTAKVT